MTEQLLYEKKYLDEDQEAHNLLVAPQTSGAKILHLYDFEKEGELYPEFKDKKVSDIGCWFSSLVFELLPSIQEITLVDPIYAYNKKTYIAKEFVRAEKRLRIHETLTSEAPEAIITKRKEVHNDYTAVFVGMKKWKDIDLTENKKVIFNTSLAQNIEWIQENSQDVVFLNFVLDKLQGYEGMGKEIHAALDSAYAITKPWGKIYCLQDNDYKSDMLLDVMQHTDYKRNAHYKGNRTYVVFTLDKEG